MKLRKLPFILLILLCSFTKALQVSAQEASAIFAGGCFWCMEPPYEKLDGVSDAVSGYIGGSAETANYKDVSAGKTKHFEAVEVFYDSSKISYQELVEVFWKQIDPTDNGGSFVDRGPQYRSAIFYKNEEEKNIAEKSKAKLNQSKRFNKPVVTEILPATNFYKAEDYHQNYYLTNSTRYKFYRSRSGRDQFMEKYWKNADKNKSALNDKQKRLSELTPLQFYVTQEDGTERPFENAYWDNKNPGIYVDIVSGEALFSSTHKYKSGTGWPSFFDTIAKENIVEHDDFSLFLRRVEVRSKNADSHLGHLFEDGPPPTGLRYCINSAALDFIPLEQLEQRGYGKYKYLFETQHAK